MRLSGELIVALRHDAVDCRQLRVNTRVFDCLLGDNGFRQRPPGAVNCGDEFYSKISNSLCGHLFSLEFEVTLGEFFTNLFQTRSAKVFKAHEFCGRALD